MKSSAFYAVLGVGVILAALAVWWGVSHMHKPQSAQTTASQTVPVVSVATSTIQGMSISVRNDEASVSSCLKTTTGEVEHAPVIVQGIEWERFSEADGKTTAYRIVHNSSCFEVQETATGSPESILGPIVQSFGVK